MNDSCDEKSFVQASAMLGAMTDKTIEATEDDFGVQKGEDDDQATEESEEKSLSSVSLPLHV